MTASLASTGLNALEGFVHLIVIAAGVLLVVLLLPLGLITFFMRNKPVQRRTLQTGLTITIGVLILFLLVAIFAP